jgi:trehalose-6-phosphate synthase
MIYLFQDYRLVFEAINTQEPNISLKPIALLYLKARRDELNALAREGRITRITPLSDHVTTTNINGKDKSVTELVVEISVEAANLQFAEDLLDSLVQRNGNSTVRIIDFEKEPYV